MAQLGALCISNLCATKPLHSKDPDIQEKIKMIRQTVKEIREANLYELHQAEYQLELSRRNQYQYENNDIAHKPKSNDFDF